jgi:O-antigen ligase
VTQTAAASPDRLSAWCGGVLAVIFALAAPAGWLGPLAFAPLAALAGLLMLRTLSLEEQDRPAGIAIITVLLWAVSSSIWSPFAPDGLGESTAAKLLAETVLFTAVVTGARRAAAGGGVGHLRVFAWSSVILGLVLLGEGLTGAAGYRALRDVLHDPIRPDLGIKNVAQGLFGLTLFAPAAILAAARYGGGVWLGLPILAGIIWPSLAFGYDATLLALGVGGVSGLIAWIWPRWGPRLIAGVVATLFLTAPALVWGARSIGLWRKLEAVLPLSWSERMGYWRHAADWISDHPARGWGLDASRAFGPGIVLHPHDAPLQIWLELGLIGAVGAAVFWVAVIAGLGRRARDPAAATAVATAAIYLTFGAFSFGVWQEWWLALGAIAAAACVCLLRAPLRRPAPAATSRSTVAVFTE